MSEPDSKIDANEVLVKPMRAALWAATGFSAKAWKRAR